jgi:hypothetical protein
VTMEQTAGGSRPIIYRYRITFQDRSRKTVAVKIDPDALALVRDETPSLPDWTKLAFHRCPNCPLDESLHERCPVAANLVEVIATFPGRRSFEEVDVIVESPNRTYAHHTTLQATVSSLLGLFMPTSGCPVLDKLRPMVEMHLPFQTREETVFRMISMYLFVQRVLEKDGRRGDWDLGGLIADLEEIGKVNKAFCERLNAMAAEDLSVDALVVLSTLGEFPSRAVMEEGVARLESLVKQLYE